MTLQPARNRAKLNFDRTLCQQGLFSLPSTAYQPTFQIAILQMYEVHNAIFDESSRRMLHRLVSNLP